MIIVCAIPGTQSVKENIGVLGFSYSTDQNASMSLRSQDELCTILPHLTHFRSSFISDAAVWQFVHLLDEHELCVSVNVNL